MFAEPVSVCGDHTEGYVLFPFLGDDVYLKVTSHNHIQLLLLVSGHIHTCCGSELDDFFHLVSLLLLCFLIVFTVETIDRYNSS